MLVTMAVAVSVAACGNGQLLETSESAPPKPTVIATTTILGDVLDNLAGEQLNVVTVMPVGADPHRFQPSAKDVATIGEASAIIVNGAGFEEGLLDVVYAAQLDGVPVYEAIEAVDHIDVGFNHDDAGSSGDDDDGSHGFVSTDPHFFTDPARMAIAAQGIVDFLVLNVDAIDAGALTSQADDYIAQLQSLDKEVETTLAGIPSSRRVLVTNHAVFSYFADRYEFQVIGTVVTTGSSIDGVSGRRLAELSKVLTGTTTSAVFTDSSSTDRLAQTLAAEAGDVAVVELFSESLGADDSDGATYVEMVRSNSVRIADALSG